MVTLKPGNHLRREYAETADGGLREISPDEVARRVGLVDASRTSKPAPAPAPPRKDNLPWFAEYLDGGVDAGLVGEPRVICARAALEAACAAFYISRYERPRLRFFNPRCPELDGVDVRGGSRLSGSASGQSMAGDSCWWRRACRRCGR